MTTPADFRPALTYTAEQATQFAQGYLELLPDEVEDHKKTFHWVEKDGAVRFPFYYSKTSRHDSCYIMFRKEKEKRKYTRKLTLEEKPPIFPQ